MSAHGVQIPAQQGPGGPQMPYCPGRDFINVYPQMLQSVVRYFTQNRWPELVKMIAQLEGGTEEAANDLLCDANDAFFRLLATCCQDSSETYADVAKRVGWEALPPGARFGYLALLGCVTSGQLFAGLRDVSMEGEYPIKHIEPLLEYYWDEARRCENHISTEKELSDEFRAVVKKCQAGGFKVSELETLLSDAKLNRG